MTGIYNLMPSGGTDRGYMLADNEIIIPRKSIKADNGEHIGNFGRYVSPYNTSFRIPNGTIDEFMEKWNEKGIEDVTIHFYDKGYSKMEDGIHQMERMAYLLLAAAGCLLGCLVGALLTGTVAEAIQNQEIFDSTFSAGVIYSELQEKQTMNGGVPVTILAFLGILGFTVVISGIAAWRNLKEEPLALLAGRE